MMTSDRASQLDWAESYPFDQPDQPFTFVDGRSIPHVPDQSANIAVLASGSNASPSQLRRKFGVRRKGVLVTPVLLRDWTIVYSAHFAAYGSIPATLAPYPGAITLAFVTWLDETDLEQMHASEALGTNYEYASGKGLSAIDSSGHSVSIDGYYRSLRGDLQIGGQPIRLAMCPSTGVRWPALSQRALLRYVAKKVSRQMDYRQFLTRIIEDADFRRSCREHLTNLDKFRTL